MRRVSRMVFRKRQLRSGKGRRQPGPSLEVLENRLTPSSGVSTAVPLGAAFLVNATTVGNQYEPAIARDADGDFIIAWRGSDSSNAGVFGRRFSPAGTPQGAEFAVNQFTANDQALPSVAMDAAGNFIVSWSSNFQTVRYDTMARRYGADGTPAGDEFAVPSLLDSEEWNSDVALNASGQFVVAWSRYTGASAYEIAAKRFDAGGVAQPSESAPGQFVPPDGLEARVNTLRSGHQWVPEVAMAADGSFAVIWIDMDGQHDGSGKGIFGQLYKPDGSLRGSEFLVNTYTQGDQTGADPTFGVGLAMDPAGNFVVAWHGPGRDGDTSATSIFAQRFDRNGARVGPEFQVNTVAAGNPRGPSLAIDGDGDFVIAWESSNGIFYRRFNTAGTAQDPADVSVSASGAQAAVAMDDDGDFVVSWLGQDGSGDGISARLYDWVDAPPLVLTVQRGQTQRSFIRYLDLAFSDSTLPQQLVDQGRIQLTHLGLNGLGPSVPISLAGLLGAAGNTLAVDFGTLGLGGDPNGYAGDGLYQLGLDMDGNGSFETALAFHRLLGDVTGDGAVLADDFAEVAKTLVSSKYRADADTNGDGTVDLLDLFIVFLSAGRRVGYRN